MNAPTNFFSKTFFPKIFKILIFIVDMGELVTTNFNPTQNWGSRVALPIKHLNQIKSW
jgi:hypothetical protein